VVVVERQNRKQSTKNGSVRQQLGALGERLAAERLIRDGYWILEHNFRSRYGEIDIIAEHEQDIVFIEVKTRRGMAYGLPEEAVNRHKLRRMMRAINYYLSTHEHPYSERSWRIDVVAIQLSLSGRLEEIRIYQHAVSDVENIE
jgi:putative endonuclease